MKSKSRRVKSGGARRAGSTAPTVRLPNDWGECSSSIVPKVTVRKELKSAVSSDLVFSLNQNGCGDESGSPLVLQVFKKTPQPLSSWSKEEVVKKDGKVTKGLLATIGVGKVGGSSPTRISFSGVALRDLHSTDQKAGLVKRMTLIALAQLGNFVFKLNESCDGVVLIYESKRLRIGKVQVTLDSGMVRSVFPLFKT